MQGKIGESPRSFSASARQDHDWQVHETAGILFEPAVEGADGEKGRQCLASQELSLLDEIEAVQWLCRGQVFTECPSVVANPVKADLSSE